MRDVCRQHWHLVVRVMLVGLLLGPAVALANHTPDQTGMKGKVRATMCDWNRRHTRVRCDQENVSATIIVRDLVTRQERLRFTSDARGRYSILLPAGSYRLESDADNLSVFPGEITIAEGKVQRTTLYLNGPLEQTLSH